MFNIIKARGIALIQALMASAILSVILLSYAKSARSSVALAETLVDRTVALVQLEEARSDIELSLLTEVKYASVNGYFNRHSEPFGTDSVSVVIQDLAGLFSISGWGLDRFDLLLNQLGKSSQESKAMAMSLKDWQDQDDDISPQGAEQSYYKNYMIRNAPLQTFEELTLVRGFDEAFVKKLRRVATIYPSKHFNPLSAPPEVLAVYLDKSRLKHVLSLRLQNKLDEGALFRYTDILSNDAVHAIYGPAYRITISYNDTSVQVSQEYEATFNPYTEQPVQIWQKRRIVDANI